MNLQIDQSIPILWQRLLPSIIASLKRVSLRGRTRSLLLTQFRLRRTLKLSNSKNSLRKGNQINRRLLKLKEKQELAKILNHQLIWRTASRLISQPRRNRSSNKLKQTSSHLLSACLLRMQSTQHSSSTQKRLPHRVRTMTSTGDHPLLQRVKARISFRLMRRGRSS